MEKISINDYRKIINKGKSEHDIQASCVRWYDLNYPHSKNCLFAVPNGYSVGSDSKKNAISKAKMKKEGLRSGIPDLMFLNKGKAYGIELKTHIGKLSPVQKEVHKEFEKEDISIFVIRSLDSFMKLIKDINNY